MKKEEFFSQEHLISSCHFCFSSINQENRDFENLAHKVQNTL